jgi:hypothetical protein
MKIFDNVTEFVRDDMAQTIKRGSKVSIAVSLPARQQVLLLLLFCCFLLFLHFPKILFSLSDITLCYNST